METGRVEIPKPFYRLVSKGSNINNEQCAFSLNDACLMVKNEYMKISIRKFIRRNFNRVKTILQWNFSTAIFYMTKFPRAKFPYGEISLWKNPLGKISLQQNFHTAKFPTAKLPTTKIHTVKFPLTVRFVCLPFPKGYHCVFRISLCRLMKCFDEVKTVSFST